MGSAREERLKAQQEWKGMTREQKFSRYGGTGTPIREAYVASKQRSAGAISQQEYENKLVSVGRDISRSVGGGTVQEKIAGDLASARDYYLQTGQEFKPVDFSTVERTSVPVSVVSSGQRQAEAQFTQSQQARAIDRARSIYLGGGVRSGGDVVVSTSDVPVSMASAGYVPVRSVESVRTPLGGGGYSDARSYYLGEQKGVSYARDYVPPPVSVRQEPEPSGFKALVGGIPLFKPVRDVVGGFKKGEVAKPAESIAGFGVASSDFIKRSGVVGDVKGVVGKAESVPFLRPITDLQRPVREGVEGKSFTPFDFGTGIYGIKDTEGKALSSYARSRKDIEEGKVFRGTLEGVRSAFFTGASLMQTRREEKIKGFSKKSGAGVKGAYYGFREKMPSIMPTMPTSPLSTTWMAYESGRAEEKRGKFYERVESEPAGLSKVGRLKYRGGALAGWVGAEVRKAGVGVASFITEKPVEAYAFERVLGGFGGKGVESLTSFGRARGFVRPERAAKSAMFGAFTVGTTQALSGIEAVTAPVGRKLETFMMGQVKWPSLILGGAATKTAVDSVQTRTLELPYKTEIRGRTVSGVEKVRLFGLETPSGRAKVLGYGRTKGGRAEVGLGTPDLVADFGRIPSKSDVKIGSALETEAIVRNIRSAPEGAVTVRGKKIIEPTRRIVRGTREMESDFINEAAITRATERLPTRAVETVLNIGKQEGMVLFGSKVRDFKIPSEFKIEGKTFKFTKKPRDIELRGDLMEEGDLSRVTDITVKRLRKLGTIEEGGTKFELGTAREIKDTPFAIEAKVKGKFEKVVELKGRESPIEEAVPEFVLGVKKVGVPSKTRYGIKATTLSEELRGVTQGMMRLTTTKEGKIDIFPPPKRVKDIGSFSVSARTLSGGKRTPYKGLEADIKTVEGLFPKKLVREQVTEVFKSPKREMIASFSPKGKSSFSLPKTFLSPPPSKKSGSSVSPLRSFSPSGLGKSVSSSFSPKSFSPLVSVSRSASPSKSFSPSFSPVKITSPKSKSRSVSPSKSFSPSFSPSPSRSPSPSFSPYKSYVSGSRSVSRSVSRSPSISGSPYYGSPSASPSPSGSRSSSYTGGGVALAPSIKFPSLLEGGKRKKGRVRFRPKYFASVEASLRNIRGAKPSKRSVAMGLDIRPIVERKSGKRKKVKKGGISGLEVLGL